MAAASVTTECCGVVIAADHRYCSKCGCEARLAEVSSPARPDEKTPACVNDTIRRADVVTMWNEWRCGLPADAPFRHNDGVAFLDRLNEIEGAASSVSSPARPQLTELLRIRAEQEAICYTCTRGSDPMYLAAVAIIAAIDEVTTQLTGSSATPAQKENKTTTI